MFEIVMVGADDSETAKRAVEVATDIAAMYGATLHIVTAFEKGARKGDVAPEFTHVHTEDDGLALLQTLSFIAKKQNIEPALHSVRGDAAAALLGKAKEIIGIVANRDGLREEGRAQQDKAKAARDVAKKEAEAESSRAAEKAAEARQKASSK